MRFTHVLLGAALLLAFFNCFIFVDEMEKPKTQSIHALKLYPLLLCFNILLRKVIAMALINNRRQLLVSNALVRNARDARDYALNSAINGSNESRKKNIGNV